MFTKFMRSSGHVTLLALVLFFAPSTAAAVGLEDAKIALHLQTHTTKNPCATLTAPTIPCYQYQTAGDVGVGYDLYLVVGNIPVGQYGPYEMSALSCGIEYDGAPGQGVDVYSWTFCGDGLQFPKEGPLGPWPNAGTGIRLTWLTCYTQDIPPSGGHNIAGSFYVYAYGTDRFSITENRNLESGPEFKLAECDGSELDLPLSAAGAVAFSSGKTDAGYNPCPQDFVPICDVPDRSVSFGPVGIGGYTDLVVNFSNDGEPENGLVEGTVTETCPDVTIMSGETYSLPERGDQASVVLRYTPTTLGPTSCNVNLGSTCSLVQITGSGVTSPHPEVDPQSIVREVWTETSRSQSFQVSNLGGANLIWDVKLEFGTLEDVLAGLDAHSAAVIGSIPNRYNFSGGATGNSLGSPTFSSLSNGNYLTTDIGIALGQDLDYSEGVIRASNLLGPGGRYFTRKYPGLFVFVGEFVGVEQFKVHGRLSPGYSNIDYFWIRDLSLPGYMAVLHRNWGDGDATSPSLHQVFITLDLPNVSFSYHNRFDENEPGMNQLRHVTRFYYFLYMGANNADIPVSAATQTINTFLEAFHPAVPWMTTAAAGVVVPQGSGTGEIAFSALGLAPGEYRGQASIRSNSVHRPVLVVPVTMQVTVPSTVDVAGIEIDPNTLNPGSNGPWVNAYIELPSGDDPSEVVLETVRTQDVPADPSGFEIGDNDADGVPDLRFRFDRKAFLQALPPQDQVEAWVSGEILDQHYFVGRQFIRVLRPHLNKPNGGERLQAGTFVEILCNLDEVGSADALTASYSLNGGSTWTQIGTVAPSQPLLWQVPGEVTDQGLMRVEASRDGLFLGYDVSDMPFSVVTTTTGILPGVPVTALLQNAPNPFSTSTRIAYSLADPGRVRLEVFNLSGMRVRTLVEGLVAKGDHEASWDGRDDTSRRMPSGIYIVRLRTPLADVSRRMLLVP